MARPITAPRVPRDLTPVDLSHGGLTDEAELTEVALSGHGGAARARGVEIHEARLDDVDLGGATLAQLSLRDCVITGGTLANLSARGGTVQRTSITGARLTGLAITEGTVRDVSFTNCLLDYASFAASRLERVRFQGCNLADVDLADAQLVGAVFDDCSLVAADLSGARFGTGCALRDCDLDQIRGLERLRGAVMPVDDIVASATLFAAALGIRTLTDDEEDPFA